MDRHADWLAALTEFIEARRATPHAWGTNDCCVFVADAVQAMTGVDPAAEYRGYSTEKQALAILKKAGGMEALFTAHFGNPVGILQARRGDIVLGDATDGTPAVGICLGNVVAYVAEQGLQFHPLASQRLAWKVG